MAISYKVVHQLRANKLRQLEQNKFLFFELQKFEKLIYGLKIKIPQIKNPTKSLSLGLKRLAILFILLVE